MNTKKTKLSGVAQTPALGPVGLKLREALAEPKPHYWLMKSEPETYGAQQWNKDKTTWWEGVRNFQARNFMVQNMSIGDVVLFYHSNATPSGIVALGTVSQSAKVDTSAFDPHSPYFDPSSSVEKPRWFCVQVKFGRMLPRCLDLAEIKAHPELQSMLLTSRGQRLSIQPVTHDEWRILQTI